MILLSLYFHFTKQKYDILISYDDFLDWGEGDKLRIESTFEPILSKIIA